MADGIFTLHCLPIAFFDNIIESLNFQYKYSYNEDGEYYYCKVFNDDQSPDCPQVFKETFSFCTWNSAALFGQNIELPKRRIKALFELVDNQQITCVQETHDDLGKRAFATFERVNTCKYFSLSR